MNHEAITDDFPMKTLIYVEISQLAMFEYRERIIITHS